MTQKRQSHRLPIAARVSMVNEEGEKKIFITENISEGGLYLKAEQPPFVGTDLELEISLPDTEELMLAKGKVIWRQEGRGCGVGFTRLTQKNKKLLSAYLDSES